MKIYKITLILSLIVMTLSCTKDFDKINTDPQLLSLAETEARTHLTEVQAGLYGPGRFEYWRAQLIHADRFSGQVTFGSAGSWWSDELAYDYSEGYTNNTWDWLEKHFGSVDNFLKITDEGSEYENKEMHAVALIMKGLYFQLFTDTFGEIPYSESGDIKNLLPAFDTQEAIYTGIIAELDVAMGLIGSSTSTGTDVNDLSSNDLFFNGDLQMWKKLANSLKLRIAMRGGSSFSNALSEALNAPLLGVGESALMQKDLVIDQFGSSAYGDVWHNFGGFGSKWTVGKVVIDYLRDNNDPRLPFYAQPTEGGAFNFLKGDPKYSKHLKVITDELDAAGAVYSIDEITKDGNTYDSINVTGGYYAGQPVRLSSGMKSFARQEFFSYPGATVIEPKGGGQMFPEIVMSSAEVFFLRAEAALDGSGEDAQAMFESGISEAMTMWGVDAGDISTYIATEDLANLGTGNAKEKVAVQRWLAAYTDGFEAWSVVRDSGFPASLAAGVSDSDIYGLGTINGAYPQRMRYGSSASSKNGDNLDVAIGRQGADNQGTKLWWAQ